MYPVLFQIDAKIAKAIGLLITVFAVLTFILVKKSLKKKGETLATPFQLLFFIAAVTGILIFFGKHTHGYIIGSYGFMTALGVFTGVFATYLIARKREEEPFKIVDILFLSILCGFIGGRLLFVILFPAEFQNNYLKILQFSSGGFVYYGGLIGAIAGMIFFCYRSKIDFFKIADYGSIGLAIGHAFGRIGCFLGGCCYGRECVSISGVSYPPDSPAWKKFFYEGHIMSYESTPSLHAVQLYESSFNLILFGLLLYIFYKRMPFIGLITAAYLLGYGTIRMITEFFRGDRIPQGFPSTAQIISFFILAAGITVYIITRKKMDLNHE